MLEGNDVGFEQIDELGGPPVRRRFVIGAGEGDLRGIGVARLPVVHGDDGTVGVGQVGRDGAAEVAGVRGDAAATRHVVADPGDAVEWRGVHGGLPRAGVPAGRERSMPRGV